MSHERDELRQNEVLGLIVRGYSTREWEQEKIWGWLHKDIGKAVVDQWMNRERAITAPDIDLIEKALKPLRNLDPRDRQALLDAGDRCAAELATREKRLTAVARLREMRAGYASNAGNLTEPVWR
jgi:hypothetical protein